MVQHYFKGSNGSNVGPISADEFRQRQEAGEIEGATMVWRSGMGEWTTYSAMCAADLLAASPAPQKVVPPTPSQPAKAKVSVAATASPRTGFKTCQACNKEWPESLLFTESGQRVCGNCQTRLKEQAENARPKRGASAGLAGVFFIAVAIACAGGLAYKITHPGPPVPHQRAPEMVEASTYGAAKH